MPDGGSPATLTVEVRPRAGRDEVVGWIGGALRLKVRAAPAGGAANDAVRELLAAVLDRPLSSVTIVRGHRARTKVVRVSGLSSEGARARLSLAPGTASS
jgi:hypothetical protein